MGLYIYIYIYIESVWELQDVFGTLDWIVFKGRHVTIVVYKLLEYLGPFHIEFSY